ncbi:MAG TPA: 3-hydroxyacyl-CoA dehydrogenase NAD-binding domain-containing protein, partial [Polyangiaceae bacterium]
MKTISVVGVVGAGQMGRGIAQVAAQSGFEVHLADASAAALEAGHARIGQDLKRLVAKGKIPEADASATLGRIHPAASLGNLSSCDFVIEAATENTDLKLQIFRDLDELLPADTLLA